MANWSHVQSINVRWECTERGFLLPNPSQLHHGTQSMRNPYYIMISSPDYNEWHALTRDTHYRSSLKLK